MALTHEALSARNISRLAVVADTAERPHRRHGLTPTAMVSSGLGLRVVVLIHA